MEKYLVTIYSQKPNGSNYHDFQEFDNQEEDKKLFEMCTTTGKKYEAKGIGKTTVTLYSVKVVDGSNVLKTPGSPSLIAQEDEDEKLELQIREIRSLGYAVTIFTPEELRGVDPRNVEEILVERGNDAIADLYEEEQCSQE